MTGLQQVRKDEASRASSSSVDAVSEVLNVIPPVAEGQLRTPSTSGQQVIAASQLDRLARTYFSMHKTLSTEPTVNEPGSTKLLPPAEKAPVPPPLCVASISAAASAPPQKEIQFLLTPKPELVWNLPGVCHPG